ncbi:hypothetical protein GCM10007862_20990 [Dyella lipolytica]|uniref:X-Tfes XVIPCD domain-containing protein n=1 Tax=Dyella lipolytica TaxID=1867835 RepID=A0ABW8ITT6_9GAMM|nr:XVIPCD domain-containing protein [Dyella lipolytica]GLQ47048.1 hypothetical protein GCM10007862_20990 [Dyella lipolytica]
MDINDPSLGAVLNQFAKQSGVTADQAAQLRKVFDRYSNLLLGPFTEYAKTGQLTRFAIAKSSDEPNLTGAYDPLTGVITLPANSFKAENQTVSGDLTAAVFLQGMIVHLAHQTYQDEKGTTQTVSPEMIRNLQSVFNDDPVVASEVKRAVLAGSLRYIGILDPKAGLGGRYDFASKTMLLLADDLVDPLPPKTFSAEKAPSLAFILGHEIQHALHRNQQIFASRQFIKGVENIAASPQLDHDYSGPVRTMFEECRWDEASAEIAGWNALVCKVRVDNPSATLNDVFDAEPNRACDFVELDSATKQYRAKPGLSFNADLTLSDTEENLDAMGKYYFDQPAKAHGHRGPSMALGSRGESDYRNHYGKDMVKRIISEERTYAVSVDGKSSKLELNMRGLGLNRRLMERDGLKIDIRPEEPQRYYDTGKRREGRHYFHNTVRHEKDDEGVSTTLSAKDMNNPSHPSNAPYRESNQQLPSERSSEQTTPHDPRHSLHRDHAQYQSIRGQTRELFARHGVPLDGDRLERTTAAIMRDVKAHRMTRVATMEFSADRLTGQPDLRGNVIAYSDEPQKLIRSRSVTSIVQAQQTPPEQSYLQREQVPHKDQTIDQPLQPSRARAR